MPSRPGGLERHRLAAGIGTADDELPLLVVQRQGQRNHGCLPRAQALFEQRVARLLELKHRRRGLRKPGTYAVELGGKSRLAPAAHRSGPEPPRPGRWRGIAGRSPASWPGRCAWSRPVLLRSAAPAHCSARWSRAAPGKPSGRSNGGAMHHAGNAPLMLRL